MMLSRDTNCYPKSCVLGVLGKQEECPECWIFERLKDKYPWMQKTWKKRS